VPLVSVMLVEGVFNETETPEMIEQLTGVTA
jgi:hypothetical protein